MADSMLGYELVRRQLLTDLMQRLRLRDLFRDLFQDLPRNLFSLVHGY